ncbi:hypothetical protein [Gemmatimonas sp.]|uniref:hypothetical protein n=1 Tax=Gemmatimonas sp. TaxID=1962908 RepID=UPI0039837E20
MAQHLPPDAPSASLADCSLVQSHLDAYVDGELTAFDEHDRELAPIVGAHLRWCAPCARVARQTEALRAAVRAVGQREQTTVRASDALRHRAEQILSSR